MKRGSVAPGGWFGVHAIAPEVVSAYAKLMRLGRTFPPAVVVDYGDKVMPLDGHHRLSAARSMGVGFHAWIIDGDVFEDLCQRRRDAGKYPPDTALVKLADRLERKYQ